MSEGLELLSDEDAAKYWWRKCGELEKELEAVKKELAQRERFVEAGRELNAELDDELQRVKRERDAWQEREKRICVFGHIAAPGKTKENCDECRVIQEVNAKLKAAESSLAAARKAMGEKDEVIRSAAIELHCAPDWNKVQAAVRRLVAALPAVDAGKPACKHGVIRVGHTIGGADTCGECGAVLKDAGTTEPKPYGCGKKFAFTGGICGTEYLCRDCVFKPKPDTEGA